MSSHGSSAVGAAMDAAVDSTAADGGPKVLPTVSGDHQGRSRSLSQTMSECSDDGEGPPDRWEDESLRLSLADRRGITKALSAMKVTPVFMDDAVREEATRRIEGRRIL